MNAPLGVNFAMHSVTSRGLICSDCSLQEVVKRSWQGILNLMLDQLETFGKNLTLAVEVALRTRSYGLALRLIGKVKHGWTLYSDKQTMLHLLAREAPCDSHQEIQKRVSVSQRGFPFVSCLGLCSNIS